MTKRTDNSITSSVRLAPQLVDEIEDYKDRLSMRFRGANVTWSDAARELIIRGLQTLKPEGSDDE